MTLCHPVWPLCTSGRKSSASRLLCKLVLCCSWPMLVSRLCYDLESVTSVADVSARVRQDMLDSFRTLVDVLRKHTKVKETEQQSSVVNPPPGRTWRPN